MGLLSILLSALALVCAGVGVLTTPFPVLGLVFAFGAPVLALAGVMLGGTAMSRAKRAGQTDETARIGVILNVIAFVPGLLVALTCGVCNALFSVGDVRVHKDFNFGVSPSGPGGDGGVKPMPPPQRFDKPNADPKSDDNSHEPRPRRTPPPGSADPEPQPRGAPEAPQDRPSGTLPPPPLPPGPGK